MRRLCRFLPVLFLAAPLTAQAPAPTPAPARTVKLADHLYEITTFAGNPIGIKVLAIVAAVLIRLFGWPTQSPRWSSPFSSRTRPSTCCAAPSPCSWRECRRT